MESDISIYHLLCLLSGFLAVSMGFFLLIIKSRTNRSNIFLGVLLLAYSLFFIPGLLEAIGLLQRLPHVIRLNFFTGALAGPLIYLYCKSSIHQKALRFKDYSIHFVPFLLSIIWFWPTLIKSSEEKLAIYKITHTTGVVPEPTYIILMMVILSLMYTLISIGMAATYVHHLRGTKLTIDVSFHRWLIFLSCALIFPIIVVAIITITDSEIVTPLATLITMSTIVFSIYFTLIFKPKFFHKMPAKIPTIAAEQEEKTKYQKSYLQENQKKNYLTRILTIMESQKLYLDSKLTVSEFSERLRIAPHYVSQIINEKLEVNFLDFVNAYRVKDVKSKLKSNEFNHFTIITLAYESGFNSKTAFYSAFKKNVGTTPSQFRKEHQSVLT